MLGGVFISYRREDSGGYAGRIYDRLRSRLGQDTVFFDVDAIPPGRDFVEVLSERVGKCDALIAIIGRHWASSVDGESRRRLDDPNDFVRIEIEAALERNVPVIPVLVDGAALPQAAELPDGLKKLVRRQAIEISLTRFDSDAERLTDALSQIEDDLRRRETGAAPAVGAKAPPNAGRQATPQRGAQAPAAKQVGRRSLLTLAILGLVVAAGAAALLVALGSRPGEKAADPLSAGAERAATPLVPGPAAAIAPAAKAAAEPEWLTRDEFQTEFKKQTANGKYPDSIMGGCKDGVAKIHAHWTQRPWGLDWRFFGAYEEGFITKNAELSAQGFTLRYDNTFEDCDGRARHQALWTKGS